ncbi:MAG: RluA family pseudouridine synthase [Rhodomicrobium sp.]
MLGCIVTSGISSSSCRHTVDETGAGTRLDRFLASRIETLSRARLQDLIRGGRVTARGRPVTDPSAKVREGDSFEVEVPAVEPYALAGEPIALRVVYEDDSLIVIDKPAGLVVHPGAGNRSGTLVNALIAHCGESLSGIGGVARPGIVHRLDKDTSGLMVAAKTDAAHRGLARQFADHGRTGDLRRQYIAAVWGEPSPRAGRIETRIARHTTLRTKMATVTAGGRIAITSYETLHTYRLASISPKGRGNNPLALSVVRCNLETGRTHQVRVHMAHIGTPIAGDSVYGAGFASKSQALPPEAAAALNQLRRQALHAAVLRFRHPVTGKILAFESGLPGDIANLCEAFERLDTKLSKN